MCLALDFYQMNKKKQNIRKKRRIKWNGIILDFADGVRQPIPTFAPLLNRAHCAGKLYSAWTLCPGGTFFQGELLPGELFSWGTPFVRERPFLRGVSGFFPGGHLPRAGTGTGAFFQGDTLCQGRTFSPEGELFSVGPFLQGELFSVGGLFSRENIFTQEGPVMHLLPELCEVFVLSSDCGLSQLVRRASFPSFPSDSRPRLPTICW